MVGENVINESFYLFNYLKDNYSDKIFLIKPKQLKCYNVRNYLCKYNKINSNEPVLKMKYMDKFNFINHLKYLFVNDLLLIFNYNYHIDNNDNKPTKIIKFFLDNKLQPVTSIFFNNNTFNIARISKR